MRFKQSNANDTTCKLTVPLKNFKINSAFECHDIWWLPPGPVFSVQGEVGSDDTLRSLELNWGHITYAKLIGNLKQASGKASGQAVSAAIGGAGDVVVDLALLPLGQQTKKTPEKDKAATELTKFDGRYVGSKICSRGFFTSSIGFSLEAVIPNADVNSLAFVHEVGKNQGSYPFQANLGGSKSIVFKIPWNESEFTGKVSCETTPPTVVIEKLDCRWALKKLAPGSIVLNLDGTWRNEEYGSTGTSVTRGMIVDPNGVLIRGIGWVAGGGQCGSGTVSDNDWGTFRSNVLKIETVSRCGDSTLIRKLNGNAFLGKY